MREKIIVLLFCTILVIFGCTTSTKSNEENQDFSIKINLTDENNEPLEGYQVSIANKITLDTSIYSKARTSFHYFLEKRSNVEFVIYDVENNLVTTLLDNEEQNAGNHSIQFIADNYDNGTNISGGSLVFKCEFIVKDCETYELLCDTTAFICRYLDFDNLGNTDSVGVFTSTDKKLIPWLYDFSEQNYTDDNGNLNGEFTFIDSVDITLVNPVTETYNTFTKKIKAGNNIYDLVWDNSTKSGNKRNEVDSTSVIHRDNDINAFKTEFNGNYPNPFK